MSAQTFDVVAVVLPNPEIDSSSTARIINASLGYTVDASSVIRTLSSKNPNHLNAIEGLLYVPSVKSYGSACSDDELALVPSNATTRASFPPENYPFIGVAPWTSTSCIEAYVSSMRADGVVGAIFYHNDDLETATPAVSSSSWLLNGTSRWPNDYPVYALPGAIGTGLMKALALYSGNMSSAPLGNQLVQIYNSTNLVRLYSRIDVSDSSNMPSLWIFLIIVLAILLLVVIFSTLTVHILHRRQRALLARRVANGEVDLEALGIKRLNVPQELIDSMPSYAFVSKPSADSPEAAAPEPCYDQSMCPICMDDFVNEDTMVRELPCKHIFHPECIDTYLRDNSSLCPMCKKSVLPPGYCPVDVTNLMVRRERLLRRMRERENASANPTRRPTVALAVRRRLQSLRRPAPTASESGGATSTELSQLTSNTEPAGNAAIATHDVQVPVEVHAQGVSARRAWLREWAARQHEQAYAQAAEQARVVDETRPLWRRIAGRLNSRWD